MILHYPILVLLLISTSSLAVEDSDTPSLKFKPYPGVPAVIGDNPDARGASAPTSSSNDFAHVDYEKFFDNNGASSTKESSSSSEEEKDKKTMYNDLSREEKRQRAIKLLEIRRERIAQLRAQYEQEREAEMMMIQEQEAAAAAAAAEDEEAEAAAAAAHHEEMEYNPTPRQLQLQLLHDYLSEWQRYKPQEYYPPPAFYSRSSPAGPICRCQRYDDAEHDEIPIARTFSDSPLPEQHQEMPQHPIPNRRYMKPLKTRTRRSVNYIRDDDDGEDPYWYYEGEENRVLENVNLGYRAKEHYAQTIPYLIRPLHYGTIYTGQKNHYRKYRYDADFNLPYDLYSFNRRPYYPRRRYYYNNKSY